MAAEALAEHDLVSGLAIESGGWRGVSSLNGADKAPPGFDPWIFQDIRATHGGGNDNNCPTEDLDEVKPRYARAA